MTNLPEKIKISEHILNNPEFSKSNWTSDSNQELERKKING